MYTELKWLYKSQDQTVYYLTCYHIPQFIHIYNDPISSNLTLFWHSIPLLALSLRQFSSFLNTALHKYWFYTMALLWFYDPYKTCKLIKETKSFFQLFPTFITTKTLQRTCSSTTCVCVFWLLYIRLHSSFGILWLFLCLWQSTR